MVTGDHPITAEAIAKNVGIISKDSNTIESLAKSQGMMASFKYGQFYLIIIRTVGFYMIYKSYIYMCSPSAPVEYIYIYIYI